MTPLVLAPVIAIWLVAAVLWLLDAPSPQHTTEAVLSQNHADDEPVTPGLKVVA